MTQVENYKQYVKEKGGHVLEKRTRVKDVCIGDRFTIQGKGEVKTVLFFYKDRVFNGTPLAFGVSDDGKTTCMLSVYLITKI